MTNYRGAMSVDHAIRLSPSTRAFSPKLLALVAVLILATAAFGQAVLHDNGPLITNPGEGAGGTDLSVLQTALGLDMYGGGVKPGNGHSLADEFEVTTDGGWQLAGFEIPAYQTNSGLDSTLTGAYFQIWDGPPGEAGSTVLYGDLAVDRLVDSTFSGIYRVRDTDLANTTRPIMTNVVAADEVYLPRGTYWLEFQVNGDDALAGPWVPPVTVLGETTTGDAYQRTLGAGWNPWVDTGTAATAQGVPFVVLGQDAGAELTPRSSSPLAAEPGDTLVPVLAFSASTNMAPTVDLTLGIVTLNHQGTGPASVSPGTWASLFLDANGDGVADDPSAPLAAALLAPDGTGTLTVENAGMIAGAGSGFVLAYDLKASLADAALPVVAASLALVLPGWWLARRGKRGLLAALALVALVATACGTPTPPAKKSVQFRAAIASASVTVANGQFAGEVAPVTITGERAVGPVITVEY